MNLLDLITIIILVCLVLIVILVYFLEYLIWRENLTKDDCEELGRMSSEYEKENEKIAEIKVEKYPDKENLEVNQKKRLSEYCKRYSEISKKSELKK